MTPIQPSPSLIGPEEFSFLGHQGSLEVFGWDGLAREKLWRYNQHYFNDLNASSASERHKWHLTLLKNWVEQNPPALGVGWEPYPISLRMVNWIKWSLAGNSLSTLCIQSLATQARFLSKRLEWHLLGNHLLANAKALVFAGLFFQGDEATAWLKTGLRIIESELAEQVLQDGGHFERSPMYHAIVLEDLLDLINASQLWSASIDSSVTLGWRAVAREMFFWLGTMTHPDGQISFFNDAAFNIAASLGNLLEYAQSLGIKIEPNLDASALAAHKLEESGYIRLSSSNAAAFLDVAPVGPDYLPGHAHADSLSFELSIFCQRIIVNGGTSLYGVGPDRLRERQTKSHSTVEVNDQSSSEVWGGFRVARRAQPFDLRIMSAEDQISIGCSHDGYARLKGKPIHHREWNMTANDLTISDRVTGGEYKSIARFILHPSVSIDRLNANDWRIYMPLGQEVLFKVLSGNGFVESANYAPEFGTVVQTQCLAIELALGRSQAKLQWN
jgi:uncharacterized heparinase superfamily protein